MSDNLKFWDKMRTPPKGALKTISYGNLKGKSDINPQWRMQAMTETFGPCGLGWKYEKAKEWTVPGPHETVAAFVDILLYIKEDDKWSDPIPGTGGSMLIIKDRNGLHMNDEAFKMATTDALSVAMKQVGVAADIYMGIMDGSKYQQPRNVSNTPNNPTKKTPTAAPQAAPVQKKSKLYDEAWELYESKKACLDPKVANWAMECMNLNTEDGFKTVLDKLKDM